MAAYGSLTSLLQILNDIIFYTPHRELESLREKVSLLLDYLDNSPNYYSSSSTKKLEIEIRVAADAASDLIDSHISNKLLLKSETYSEEKNCSHMFSLVWQMLLSAPFFWQPKKQSEISGETLNFISYEYRGLDWNVSKSKSNPLLSSSQIALEMKLHFAFQSWLCAVTYCVREHSDVELMVEDSVIPRSWNESLGAENIDSQGYEAYKFFLQFQRDIQQRLEDRELDEQVRKEINFIINLTKTRKLYFSFSDLSRFGNLRVWQILSASRKVVSALRKQLLVPSDPELRRVTREFRSITKKVIKIKDACTSSSEDQPTTRNILPTVPSSRLDSRFGQSDVMVGFDCELGAIKAGLVRDSSKVEIISIVGMGGIGKTTLARKAYHDPYIVSHFHLCAWVTVSQEYSVRKILLGLLASTEKHRSEMHTLGDGKLAEYLHKSLKGRRYLIVMDDIWDIKVWDFMKRFFPDDDNGSRILLTSRLVDVAKSCGPIHPMRFLTNDESWNLLSRKVFGAEECPLELRGIGKEIAHHCGGLPLALVVAGGLLSGVRRNPTRWRDVADNFISLVAKQDEKCLEILSLSYNHLPHQMKVCFLYLGVFPEDFEFPVSKLIRLWAAEGILKPHISKSMELVAEEYLEDLIQRSLVSVCSWTRSGKVKTCNIHDLLREFCLRNAEKENVFHADNRNSGDSFTNTCRRLCTHPYARISENKFSSMLSTCSRVRSILCTGRDHQNLTNIHLPFRLLRVLDLVILYFSSFPHEITELVNLRYLALTFDKALPPSILKLWNLQTIVHYTRTLGSPVLPIEILMMPKLRHLCFTSAFFAKILGKECKANDSFILENLQTLMVVRDFVCSTDMIKRIPNLKKLGISYNGYNSRGWSSYQFENLVGLHQLEALKFVVINSRYNYMPHAEKLAFPLKLKKLTLRGCRIPWKYMTTIGALPNLEVLKLQSNAFHGLEWEPVEGEFLQLKFLLIEETNLMHWRADNTHFPNLQHLIIRSCSRILEIPSSIGDISTLQMIELFDCGPSAVNSAKQIREEQQDMG